MKNIVFLSLLIFLSACSSSQDLKVERLDAGLDVIIEKNPEIKIIASGFTWCEGPLWLTGSKTLLFSDVPNNIIYSWSEKGGLSKYLNSYGVYHFRKKLPLTKSQDNSSFMYLPTGSDM